MSNIKNNTKINQTNIPGTYDSETYNINKATGVNGQTFLSSMLSDELKKVRWAKLKL